MDRTISRHSKFRRVFITILSISAILAMAIPVTAVAYARSGSSFLGNWEAVDLDGSDMRIAFGGRPDGPFQISWTDNYISFCNGGAGIVRGTGWLSEGDWNLLEADLYLECFTSQTALEFHVTFRYHPATNTLSTRYSFGQVTIWHRPGTPPEAVPALNLRVNYGHDWVESFYEGGHMAWITVTESDGVTVKATSELVTEPKDYWGGGTGFQSLDSVWFDAQGNPMEKPPDIQPLDWVFGWVDNGATAQVQIGDIRGTIDLAADSVEGTISVPWFSDTAAPVDCHSWGAPLPNDIQKDDTVQLNGLDTYACSWAGEWDIQPYQDVGVGYYGPDGHWVANVFFARNARIVASAAGDWFWTAEFNPGRLDLFVYESAAEGAILSWQGSRDADESGFVLVGSPDHGLDLLPGNYLIVSDGMHQKGLVLETITMEVFDTENEIMAGIAPAGRDVTVVAGMAEAETQATIDLTAELVSGAWMADFSTIQFDITEDMRTWSFAQIFDEDGDANEANPPALAESIMWVASYTYDMESWAEGTHTYHYEAQWNGGGDIYPEVSFEVSNEAISYDGYVLLRGLALRANIDGTCPVVDPPVIRPNQLTRFHNGYTTEYPMTYAEAQAFFDSLTASIIWDGGEPVELVRHEIIPFREDEWPSYFCTFTQ